MTTIRLATKGCPATGCKSDKTRIIYWNHSCGSKAYLDRYANVHCYNCNIEWKILESWFSPILLEKEMRIWKNANWKLLIYLLFY